MEKIFIDSDIILDLLAKREPFYSYAAELFSLVEKGKILVYVSPLIFSNLYYIIRKLQSKEEALKSLKKLKLLVNILTIDEKLIELALISDFDDFEDAIQYYTAIENDIRFLITRNKKDYKTHAITIYTAEEYLKMRQTKSDKKC